MATQQITGRQIADGSITNAKVAAGAGIASSKLANWGGDRNGGGFKLTNLADGAAATDAVTKQQLDAAVSAASAGLSVKEPARAASTANVGGTYTSTGGASARGQFTGMPNAIDGISLAAGNRVLLKNQSTAAQNGIWVVSTLGTGSNGVWDRATDFDTDAEVGDGDFLFVQEGTQATSQWVLSTNGPITIGGSSGTDLTFTQFGAGSAYNADGTTLNLTATTFSVANLGIGTGQIAADAVTNAKLANDAVNTAEIVNGAVTTAKLATGAVTANELGSNAVTTAKLAADSVTGSKIAFIAQTVTGTINGTNTNFTISAAVDTDSLIVWVNGIRQQPTADFSVASTTVTFTDAPVTGDSIAVFGIAS